MTTQPELPPPDTPATPQPATASWMLELLRRHYLPDETRPAGIFAPEIQAPGSTLRKADLMWLGCTTATGTQDVITALRDLGAVYRRRDDAKRALDDHRRGLRTDYDRIGRLLAEAGEDTP